MKILIIRTDRIGDLILSIPVIRAIKHKFRDASVSFLASEYPGQLLSDMEELDNLHLLKMDGSNTANIIDNVRKEKYSHAITLFTDKEASRIPFRAGIPFRIGPYSKLSSFLLFNRGVFQHRSSSVKNEAQYNLDLLQKIGIEYKDIPVELLKPVLKVTGDQIESVRPTTEDYYIIHPGMGGSALNLPAETYLKLARHLSKIRPVFITFGPGDRQIFEYFKKNFDTSRLLSNISLKTLPPLYAGASLFIGPSTGPMHIAAASGTRVVAIFSPVKVQSARRWGPWGNNARIITPDVTCTRKYRCKSTCAFFNCVLNLSPDKLIEEIENYVGER